MGGRGSWSASSGGTFDPHPAGGGGASTPETVLGPRIPETLAEALGPQGKTMSMQLQKGQIPTTVKAMMRTPQIVRDVYLRMRQEGEDMMSQHFLHIAVICYQVPETTLKLFLIQKW